MTDSGGFCQTAWMAAQSKDQIYFAVCNAILKMEVSKGHLKWTLSDISRDSKITRSLIYYYFGKDKKKVLEEAYRFIVATFFNVERAKSMNLRERLRRILEDMKNMPYLLVLYYLEKHKGTNFGKMIHDSEQALLKAMKSEFPDFTETEILGLYLKELGAITFQLPVEKVNRLF